MQNNNIELINFEFIKTQFADVKSFVELHEMLGCRSWFEIAFAKPIRLFPISAINQFVEAKIFSLLALSAMRALYRHVP